MGNASGHQWSGHIVNRSEWTTDIVFPGGMVRTLRPNSRIDWANEYFEGESTAAEDAFYRKPVHVADGYCPTLPSCLRLHIVWRHPRRNCCIHPVELILRCSQLLLVEPYKWSYHSFHVEPVKGKPAPTGT